MGKIEIFNSKNKQYYFRVVADNGEIVAVSEGYTTKQNCIKGINSLKENANSDIIDISDEKK
jgi:hypothetical protein